MASMKRRDDGTHFLEEEEEHKGCEISIDCTITSYKHGNNLALLSSLHSYHGFLEIRYP